MIDKKLQDLSEYIEKVYHQDPYDRFITQIKSFEKTYGTDRSESEKMIRDLFKELDNLYKRYSEISLTDEEILYTIYEYVQKNLVRHMIYQKAYDLGIDPTLFKKEMGFLFKGKPLD
jgi:hypothetical protein